MSLNNKLFLYDIYTFEVVAIENRREAEPSMPKRYSTVSLRNPKKRITVRRAMKKYDPKSKDD